MYLSRFRGILAKSPLSFCTVNIKRVPVSQLRGLGLHTGVSTVRNLCIKAKCYLLQDSEKTNSNLQGLNTLNLSASTCNRLIIDHSHLFFSIINIYKNSDEF